MFIQHLEEQNIVSAYLEPSERLLWIGKPKQGIIFTKTDIFLIPFSLIWGGFALVWETIAIVSGAPWFFILFGVPFVLVGLYMMVGRFYYDAYRRKNTIYGLTPKRILFITGIKQNRKATFITISDLKIVQLFDKPDGSGTIYLADEDPFADMFKKTATRFRAKQNKIPSIEFIPDALEVYNKIVRLQKPDTAKI